MPRRVYKILSIGFLICQICLSTAGSTEIRLMAMGSLNYIVEDETNQLNLYRFGDNVAGLIKDEETSVLMGDFSYGQQKSFTAGIFDSLKYTAFGQAFPGALREYTPFDYLAEMVDFPIFDLSGNNLTWVNRKTEGERNFLGEPSKPQAYGLNLSYATLMRQSNGNTEKVNTPLIDILYNQEYNEKFSWGLKLGGLRCGYKPVQTNSEISLTNFNTGLACGVSLAEAITLGLLLDGNLPIFTAKSGTYTATYEGPGYKAGLQAIGKIAGLKAGAKFSCRGLNTEGKDSDNDPLGKFNVKGYEGTARFVYALPVLPIKLGWMFGYDSQNPVDTDEDGAIDYQSKISSFNFSGGVSSKIPFGVIGFEYHLHKQKLDEISEDTVINRQKYEIKAGAEFNLFRSFFLRAGYVLGKDKPNLDADERINNRIITAGIGVKILDKISGDIAYNHKTARNDVSKEEVRQDAAMMAIKVRY